MGGDFGPSLAHGRYNFEDHFGDERDVLIPTQDFLLAQFADNPWPEYTLPRQVARITRYKWIDFCRATNLLSSNGQSG